MATLTSIKSLFRLPVLVAGLGLIPTGLAAQNFTVLHTFFGSDGGNPHAGLVLSGNTLMGRRIVAAVMDLARCSGSTLMAPVLRTCITLILTEVTRLALWFYRATGSMEPLMMVATLGQAMPGQARCSLLTPTAQVYEPV